MKRTFPVLALACLLAACAGGYEWRKPNMTQAQRDADLMACGTRTSHMEKDDPAAVMVLDRCMTSFGYEKARGP